MLRQQFCEGQTSLIIENNFSLEIGVVDLAHEFPTDTTWRQDIQVTDSLGSADRNDLLKCVFSSGDHRRQRGSLSANAPACRIDANAPENPTGCRDYNRGDVSMQASIWHATGPKKLGRLSGL